MKFRLQSSILAFSTAFAVTFCLFASASAQTQPTITDIGALGANVSSGLAINAYGEVTGFSTTAADAAHHAFLYEPSKSNLKDLGTLGGSISEGAGINASGEVTGYSTLPGDTVTHAFLYSGGKMKDLHTLGGSYSRGTAINGSGEVTGISTLAGDTVVHAFLYSAGTMKDLGTLGGTRSGASSINDVGEVTGWSTLSADDGLVHAFLYSGGTMKDLGTLGTPNDGSNSWGVAVNQFGQVAGAAETGALFDTGWGWWDPITHAFLYSSGTMTDLDLSNFSYFETFYSCSTGINDFGAIVGGLGCYPYSDTFLYTPDTGALHLGSLLPDCSDPGVGGCIHWYILIPNAINDGDQITGYGFNSNLQTALLLSPVTNSLSNFQAKLQIIGKGETHFHLTGSFTLGTDSNGADPLTQQVLLQLGSLPIPIQKGLFKKASNGEYVFQGVLGAAAVDFRIKPVTSTSFMFKVQGRTGTPFRVTNPARFILMIGNNKTMGTLPWK